MPAAIHVAPDGVLTRFTDLRAANVIGATGHGLWINTSPSPRPEDTAVWESHDDLTVLSVNGCRRTVTVDRRGAFAIDIAGHAQLILYASAPRPRGNGYSHDFLKVDLPPHDLPETINAGQSAQHFDQSDLIPAMSAIVPRELDHGPADLGVTWDLVHLSHADQVAAIVALQREFAHLANYWQQADGRTTPLSRGLSDPQITVVDEWPHTRVEVTFRHPHFPQGRLRRTVRVFDDAGRVDPALYASVHLMEDLGTGRLPSPEAAQDGVLEI